MPPPAPAKLKRARSYSGVNLPHGSNGVLSTPPPSLADVGRSHSSESVFRLRSQADRYYAQKRPGMRSGYSTPRPGSPVGDDEKQPPATSPFYKRNKRRKAEVFVSLFYLFREWIEIDFYFYTKRSLVMSLRSFSEKSSS